MFEQGRVIESGGFDELVAQNGRFAALARAQFMTGEAKLAVSEPKPPIAAPLHVPATDAPLPAPVAG